LRLEEEQALVRAAAAATLERIRQDAGGASAQVRPLLLYLEEHLLDPDLNPDRWLRACRVRDGLVGIRFHVEIGLAPGAYLWDCRLEAASRLLRDTDLPVYQIAELVCYSGRQAFSDAFKSWCGLRPTVFRRETREAIAKLGPTPEEMTSTRYLQQAMTGRLDPSRATALKERLRALCPAPGSHGAADTAAGEARKGEALDERLLAARVWEHLKVRPIAEQRAVVRRQICFRTTALFDLLRAESREAGRQDPRRGVELAELALASLEGCGEALGEDLPKRQAQGWICLADALGVASELVAVF
jgi:AraC-like DNA-binding protein